MEQDLEVDRVTKRYGPHTAVDALSLAVAHGSFFSILGPSGCGKTTLLRIVAGFRTGREGDVGRRSPDARRRAEPATGEHGVPAPGAVPADVRWRERRLRPRAPGRGECGVASRVGAMLERVGLPGAQHKRVDQLSGGQSSEVAIARSLVLEPTLLLLDEPLGALDLKLREHMKIELKQLQADFGTTFVYITHDQSEALVL
jgi:spermidine/putrescine transport system ATP-binding protein